MYTSNDLKNGHAYSYGANISIYCIYLSTYLQNIETILDAIANTFEKASVIIQKEQESPLPPLITLTSQLQR